MLVPATAAQPVRAARMKRSMRPSAGDYRPSLLAGRRQVLQRRHLHIALAHGALDADAVADFRGEIARADERVLARLPFLRLGRQLVVIRRPFDATDDGLDLV